MAMDQEGWIRTRAELDAWKDASVEDLVRHLMERYHREARAGMAELEALAEEAALFEGWRTPLLLAIRDEVALFCTELRLHLRDEESTLFPAVLARAQGREVDLAHEIKEPLELFEDEHAAAEGLLTRIRTLTDGFEAPPEASGRHRSLCAACQRLAASLVAHIYLENEILFARL